MNGSGQNQVATYITGNIITGLRSQVSGNALISSDYGSTWSNVNYNIPSISTSGNVYYGGVTKVQSSSNGQYVFGISKYQDICGNTYTNTTSSAFGVGNIYLSSVPVTSGLFSTQYFGSAHTGNVFQSHGLELSVPNANNAGVLAGYDVNWDAGYINAADQAGANSLGLNTTGGFVGIGKIAPIATLDVSGNAVISGGLTIGGITNFASNVSFNTVSITSTVNSTSTTTGALTIAGGAGIGGNLNVGGFSTHAFDASFNGNIQLTQTNNPLWLISKNTSTINGTLASGNDVGIFYGTTNPAAAGLVISPRGAGGGIKMDTNGNVGIGTATPNVRLQLAGPILNGTVAQARVESIFVIGREGTLSVQNSTSFGIKQGSFDSSISSRAKTVLAISGSPISTNNYGRIPDVSAIIMQINNSALQVGIGASDPAFTLDVTGSIRATTFLNVGSPNPLTSTTGNISASGGISAASYNATSDYRMKQNTQPLLITRTIDLLKPVEYDLSGGSHDMGFLAHEVQEVLPFLVSGEKDGPGMQSMNYNGFIALLVKEVQDLKKENRELNERMNRLEKYFM
jgi:hypothetical protein